MTRHSFLAAILVAFLSTVAFAQPYIFIGGAYAGFTVIKDGTDIVRDEMSIDIAIAAIRSDANGDDCAIQFGGAESYPDVNIRNNAVRFANDASDSWGEITISGKITSENSNSYSGTIHIEDGVNVNSAADIASSSGWVIYNAGTINISGGTVLYNGPNPNVQNAVFNISTGTANISGGNIAGIDNSGKITVSGAAAIYSPKMDKRRPNWQNSPELMSFGTIKSYGGTIEILGGTVSDTIGGGASAALFTDKNTSLVLGGSPAISGNIRVEAGVLSVNDTFNPNGQKYAIVLPANAAAGDVAIAGGAAFINDFTFINSVNRIASGNDLVVAFPGYYVYAKNEAAYTITGGAGSMGIYSTVQTALDSIRADAEGTDVSIQFGSGESVLNAGTEGISLRSVSDSAWGKITLLGKITSGNGTYTVAQDGAAFPIELKADIANTSEDGFAVFLNTGSLVLDGSPKITGKISVNVGDISVNTTFAPSTKTYVLTLNGTIALGDVAIKGGAVFADNFTLRSNADSLISAAPNGNDLVFATDGFYGYAKTGTTAYAVTGGAGIYENIQAVIDTIRADAKGADISIQFGDGTGVLNIGSDLARFNGAGWGKVTLLGKITSANISETQGTVNIQGVSIDSKANIANTGEGNNAVAVYYSGTGTASISGGVVSAAAGYAVYNASTGKITVSGTATLTSANAIANQGTLYNFAGGIIEILGGTVANTIGGNAVYLYSANGSLILGGSPEITGNIRVLAETVSAITTGTNVFAPGEKQYTLNLGGTVALGNIAILGGAAYVGNFTLDNYGFGLAASGLNLVAGEPTPIVKSIAASGFGIVLNGESFQIAGVSQATPIRIYNLRGNVLMSRTAMPNESISVAHLPKGVYVVRAGGKAVKLVR